MKSVFFCTSLEVRAFNNILRPDGVALLFRAC